LLSNKDWLLKAYQVAQQSPDPSTQNGAVIPYNSAQWVAACNTFPEGVIGCEERLERPLKYQFVEHAERGVIYAAAKKGIALDGLTMYVPWAACSCCARAIICSGIRRVVTHQRMMDLTPPHWQESINHAMTMLREAGVEVVTLNEVLFGPVIRFNGQIWQP